MSDFPNQTQNAQAPAPPPPAPPPPAQGGDDANQIAMLAHLLGFVGGFIPSLIIWQVKKDVPFIAQEAKEALNFQITVAIGMVAAVIITAISFLCLHVVFLPHLVWVGNLVFCVIAALKAKDGVAYRYPFAIRLIK